MGCNALVLQILSFHGLCSRILCSPKEIHHKEQMDHITNIDTISSSNPNTAYLLSPTLRTLIKISAFVQ
ncbi:hypothetical protein BD408DRAFT_419976 [Parasitella parasitica]|nr:hypothetical protein BD408DRAFT_419976 [Parasitella parasitica]